MVFLWFCGDFFKTIYFILNQQPVQFILGGTLSLTIDLLIVVQIVVYKNNPYSTVENLNKINSN